MKAQIEVKDRKEAKLIRRGLADEETRALVKVMGALAALPSRRMMALTLQFAKEYYAEKDRLDDKAGTR